MNVDKIKEAIRVLQEELKFKRVMFDLPEGGVKVLAEMLKDPEPSIEDNLQFKHFQEKTVGKLVFKENAAFSLEEILAAMFERSDVFQFGSFRYTRTPVPSNEALLGVPLTLEQEKAILKIINSES